MLDYPASIAVATVVRAGSFEKAAKILNVTPSAISQRIKQLEERLGVILIVRGTPCIATEQGDWLCRHIDSVGLLEAELYSHFPGAGGGAAHEVTVHVATNADSLGTWFCDAVSDFARQSGYLLNVAVDDQDHTAEWLERGRVVAAVSSLARPVAGCRSMPLGSLRYRAVASPEYIARYFSNGVSLDTLGTAPTLTFNQKDRLQQQWISQTFGAEIVPPSHWLPSTQSFVDATLSGMGWSMNPALLVDAHIAAGKLVELRPHADLHVPLYWQINRLASAPLQSLTDAVLARAGAALTAN